MRQHGYRMDSQAAHNRCDVRKEGRVITRSSRTVSLFVDRSTHQWIVRDLEGKFWAVPVVVDHPWEHRQPFELTESITLEAVPGHYKSMLGLPSPQ